MAEEAVDVDLALVLSFLTSCPRSTCHAVSTPSCIDTSQPLRILSTILQKQQPTLTNNAASRRRRQPKA